MKGQSTVTTTTTTRPVYVTEMREGQVMRASDLSITVKQGDDYKRYTRGDLDARGIQIYKDGKPVLMGDLKKGDNLTAIIVTSGAPAVLTQKEVEATLAEAPAAASDNHGGSGDDSRGGSGSGGSSGGSGSGTAPAATPPAAAPAPTPPRRNRRRRPA